MVLDCAGNNRKTALSPEGQLVDVIFGVSVGHPSFLFGVSMRNLQKYPVTKEEIITFLDSLIEEYDYTKTHMVGDMRPLLLAKAKELIQRGRFDAF